MQKKCKIITLDIGRFTHRFHVYSLGTLCRLIGKSPCTIKRWQRKKYVPPPMIDLGLEFGDKYRFRWYTADEIEIYVLNMCKYGVLRGNPIEESDFFPTVRLQLKQFADEVKTGRKVPTYELDYKEMKEIHSLYGFITPEERKKKKHGSSKKAQYITRLEEEGL